VVACDLSWGALCASFTGTEKYYRINDHILVTEGLYFLVKNCGMYWLVFIFSNFLTRSLGVESFILIEIVSKARAVEVCFKNGDKKLLSKLVIGQAIIWSHGIELYACKWGKDWVMMIPSEY